MSTLFFGRILKSCVCVCARVCVRARVHACVRVCLHAWQLISYHMFVFCLGHQALLLVCITDGNEPGISWSVLCLSTLVAMVDSTAPYNPWVTSSAAISPSFLENLKHYRAISELQKLSSTVPNHAAILQILRKLGKDTPGSLMAWENMADRWQVLTTNIVEGLSDGSENQTAILASPSVSYCCLIVHLLY